MTPELAESTYRLLEKALEAYRRDYGELRSPNRMKPPSAEVLRDPEAAEILRLLRS